MMIIRSRVTFEDSLVIKLMTFVRSSISSVSFLVL